MAAGMGSRYGGLKQMEGFGPSGEPILEFSLFDAHRAGFERFVLIIRRELETAFREHVLSRLPAHLEVQLAYQEMDTAVPTGFPVPSERTKPWGTGHAVLSAREHIDGPFAVINADDFYGADSYRQLADFFRSEPAETTHALVAYRLERTLSANGGVARGVVQSDREGWLTSVVEHTDIHEETDGVIRGLPQHQKEQVTLEADAPASMNLWGFQPGFFDSLKGAFDDFLQNLQDPLKEEFYLPAAVDAAVGQGAARVKVARTPSDWFGVTYPQDRDSVQAAIEAKVRAGEYPTPLWR